MTRIASYSLILALLFSCQTRSDFTASAEQSNETTEAISPVIELVNRVEDQLPYSVTSKEVMKYFELSSGENIMITHVKRVNNNLFLIYSLALLPKII